MTSPGIGSRRRGAGAQAPRARPATRGRRAPHLCGAVDQGAGAGEVRTVSLKHSAVPGHNSPARGGSCHHGNADRGARGSRGPRPRSTAPHARAVTRQAKARGAKRPPLRAPAPARPTWGAHGPGLGTDPAPAGGRLASGVPLPSRAPPSPGRAAEPLSPFSTVTPGAAGAAMRRAGIRSGRAAPGQARARHCACAGRAGARRASPAAGGRGRVLPLVTGTDVPEARVEPFCRHEEAYELPAPHWGSPGSRAGGPQTLTARNRLVAPRAPRSRAPPWRQRAG